MANALLLIGLGIGLLETLNKSNQFNKNGGPIWAGGFICVTGIIGMIVSFQPKYKKMVTTYVVFNVIASILSAAALGLAIAGLRYKNLSLFLHAIIYVRTLNIVSYLDKH